MEASNQLEFRGMGKLPQNCRRSYNAVLLKIGLLLEFHRNLTFRKAKGSDPVVSE